MQDYEVYLIHGFCESEWEYLETIQDKSLERARFQAWRRHQEYPPELLLIFSISSTPAMDVVASIAG